MRCRMTLTFCGGNVRLSSDHPAQETSLTRRITLTDSPPTLFILIVSAIEAKRQELLAQIELEEEGIANGTSRQILQE